MHRWMDPNSRISTRVSHGMAALTLTTSDQSTESQFKVKNKNKKMRLRNYIAPLEHCAPPKATSTIHEAFFKARQTSLLPRIPHLSEE